MIWEQSFKAYIGIDSDLRWVEESRERLARVERQGLLDLEVRHEQVEAFA